MSDNLKIQDTHPQRCAHVYIRQSTATQMLVDRDSTERQYRLSEYVTQLGWSTTQIKVSDEDLAQTGSGVVTRHDFARMTHEVAMGQVGGILCLEASHIARNNAEWYRLLELLVATRSSVTSTASIIQTFSLTGFHSDAKARWPKPSCSSCTCASTEPFAIKPPPLTSTKNQRP